MKCFHFGYANILDVVILTFSVLIRSQIPNVIVAHFGDIFFITLFACIEGSEWLNAILTRLGTQSTNMWLCHTFFCYYIFKEQIYAQKYSPVIFFALIVISYLSTNKRIQKLLFAAK